MITAEELSLAISQTPSWCTLTATAQARVIIDFIQSRAAGVQGVINPAAEAIQYHNAVGPIDAMYAAFSAMDNNDTALEEWPQRAIDALAFAGWAVVPYDLPFAILGEAGMTGVFETGNPKHGWDWLVAKTRIGPHGPPAATPQPPKDAGAVPMPEVVASRKPYNDFIAGCWIYGECGELPMLAAPTHEAQQGVVVDDAMLERASRARCVFHGWDPDARVTYAGTKKFCRKDDGSLLLQWEFGIDEVRAAITAALTPQANPPGGEA